LAAAVALAGCTVTPVETLDPATIPSGEPVAHGPDAASGEIVELGSGQTLGIGWRYLIYPSAEGECLQLETVEVITTECGDMLPNGDGGFGSVGRAGLESNPNIITGITSAETATVWLIAGGGTRVAPAILMPLEPAGLEGQAFVGFAPRDVTLTHVMALAISGEVLETYELQP
jgi:hypothetical protein